MIIPHFIETGKIFLSSEGIEIIINERHEKYPYNQISSIDISISGAEGDNAGSKGVKPGYGNFIQFKYQSNIIKQEFYVNNHGQLYWFYNKIDFLQKQGIDIKISDSEAILSGLMRRLLEKLKSMKTKRLSN